MKRDISHTQGSVEERLAVYLRFLVTGDSFTNVAFSFNVGIRRVDVIVAKTFGVLWAALTVEYMPIANLEQWQKIILMF